MTTTEIETETQITMMEDQEMEAMTREELVATIAQVHVTRLTDIRQIELTQVIRRDTTLLATTKEITETMSTKTDG